MVAQSLTEEQIEILARYIARLEPTTGGAAPGPDAR